MAATFKWKKRKPFKLTKKAIRILKRVQKIILEEPKRLDMSDWAHGYDVKNPKILEMQVGHRDRNVEDIPACGTVGCIAGWTVFTAYPKAQKSLMRAAKNAARAADIDMLHIMTKIEGKQAGEAAEKILKITSDPLEKVFYTGNWPWKNQEEYHSSLTAGEYARATANRIERFIRSKGRI